MAELFVGDAIPGIYTTRRGDRIEVTARRDEKNSTVLVRVIATKRELMMPFVQPILTTSESPAQDQSVSVPAKPPALAVVPPLAVVIPPSKAGPVAPVPPPSLLSLIIGQPRDAIERDIPDLSDADLAHLRSVDTRPWVVETVTRIQTERAARGGAPAITVIAQGHVDIEEIPLVPEALPEIVGETIYDPATDAAAAPVIPALADGLADAGATVVTSQEEQDALDAAEALRTPAPLAPVKRPRRTPEEKAEAARIKAERAALKAGLADGSAAITGEKLGPEIVGSFVTDYQRAGRGDLACPECGAGIEWGCGGDTGDRGSAHCLRSRRVTVRSEPTPGGFGSGACEWHGTVIREEDGSVVIVRAAPIPALVAALDRLDRARDPVASIEAALTAAHAEPAPQRSRRYVAEADTENGTPTGTWYVADEAQRGDVAGDLFASPDATRNEADARAEADRLEAVCCIDAASDLYEDAADWLAILSAIEATIVARPDLADALDRAVRLLRIGAEGGPMSEPHIVERGLAYARAVLRPPMSEARATIPPRRTDADIDAEVDRIEREMRPPPALTPEAEDLRFLAQRHLDLGPGDLALFRRLVSSQRESGAAMAGLTAAANRPILDAALAWEQDHEARGTVLARIERRLGHRAAPPAATPAPEPATGTRILREHLDAQAPASALAALSSEGRATVTRAQFALQACMDAIPLQVAAREAEARCNALCVEMGFPFRLADLISVPS